MNRILTNIFIILAICGLCGCSQPVGNLDIGGGRGGMVDDFLLQVFKNTYYLTSPDEEKVFHRRDDYFRVRGLGSIGRIEVDDPDLKIELYSDPTSINAGSIYYLLPPGDSFKFVTEGNYILEATYQGMTDTYPIVVYGVMPNTGGGAPSGIVEKWL